MKLPVAAVFVIAAIYLSSCSSSSTDLEYLDSRVLPDLEIPPDLTLINVDSNFKLPDVFTSDGAETGNGIPVLANVDSIRLEGHSDYYWLSIDEPVGNLYQWVKDFWASEGFTLVVDEPVIGTMKTEWVYNKEGKQDEDKSFLARLFSTKEVSASQDQFKTRIARDEGTTASQIYISHRGTEYRQVQLDAQTQKYNQVHFIRAEEGDDWGFRASEPELEVEMLSRLMLYLGLRQMDVDQQLASIKLFSPRASIHTDYDKDETYILVKDDFTRAWYRTLHQIERFDFNVISANSDIGLSDKGKILVETNAEIEVDDSGFFSFSSSTKIVKKRNNLIFSKESDKITRISMETDKGKKDNSPEGLKFLTRLYQSIK